MLTVTSTTRVIGLLTLFFATIAGTLLDLDLLRRNHDGPTNEGTLFAVAFLNNAPSPDATPMAILYVLNNNPGMTAVVEVSLPRNPSFPSYPQTVSIGPNSRQEFSFSIGLAGSADIRVVNEQLLSLNKGIRVRSTNNVPVTVIGSNSESKSTDAFLALPCQTVDINKYKYFLFAAEGVSSETSQFVVVACEDGTEISTTVAGDSISASLSSFQSFGVSHGTDITGTIIESDKPVAVFSGHQCGRIPTDKSACDHLVEQIPMHAVWGTTFFTSPFGYRGSGEFYRVGSILDSNNINVTCNRRTAAGTSTQIRRTETIDAGEYYQFQTLTSPVGTSLINYRRDFCCIETSKPAIVMQYMPGHSEDEVTISGIGSGIGDPAISIVPPVEQYRSDFLSTTLNAPETFTNLVSLTVPAAFFTPSTDATDIYLDGKSLTLASLQGGSGQYVPIQCSNGEICGYGAFTPLSGISDTFQLQFNSSKDPYAGFNLNVYGYVTEMSFAYPAGFEMEPIGLPRISVYDVTVRENEGPVTIQFNRTGGDLTTNSRIFAQTRSVSGQAVAGSDYTAVGRTRIRFKPNDVDPPESDTKFVIQITDDNVAESTEYFEVFFTVDVNGYAFPGVARVTIIDNEAGSGGGVVVQFEAGSQSRTVLEGGSTTLNIALDRAHSTEARVTVSSEDGSARSPGDYPVFSMVVTFPVGQTRRTISVGTNQDSTVESDETFSLRLSSPSSGVTIGSRSTASITIQDPPSVGFQPTSYTVSENAGSAVLALVLSRAASMPVTVEFETATGTAGSSDFTRIIRNVVFSAGTTSQTVSVPIINDQINELLEVFTATIKLASGTTGINLGASTATVSITDDDSDLNVQFNPTTYTTTEGGQVQFMLRLNRPSSRQVSVSFATADSSAMAPDDYSAVSMTVTFLPGSMVQTVSVSTLTDSLTDNGETFTASLSNPSGGALTLGTAQTATATILDALAVGFVPAAYQVTEGVDASAQLTVRLNRAASVDVTVAFETRAGSALAPSDFTSSSGTLTFSAGTTVQTVPVTIRDDGINELQESFTAELTNPQGGAALGASVATVTIVDNDDLEFSIGPAARSIPEGDSNDLVVELNVETDRAVSVTVASGGGTATAGTDYTSISTIVTFQAGETDQIVTVSTLEDAVNEPDETFMVSLSNPTGGGAIGSSGSATITIQDDDAVNVQFNPAAYTATEGSSEEVFAVLNVPSTRDLTVQFETRDGTATAPGDYSAVTRTLTFSAGSTSSSVMLMAAEDNLSEPAETFSAVLRNPGSGLSLGTQDTATITIPQSDTPTVQFNPRTYAVNEGDTESLRVVLSNPSSSAVSVLVSTSDVTTQAGSDYTAITMRVTFAPGTTTQTLALTTLEDSISEQPETLTATLSSPVGASLATDPTATITIRDDDAVTVMFDPTSYTVTEGGATMATVVLSGSSTRTITVDVASSGGTATDSDDYTTVSRTLTFQPGATSVSFQVMASTDMINEVQEDFSISLSNPTNGAVLGSDNSATVFIDDGNPVNVQFNPAAYTATEGSSEEVFAVLNVPSTRDLTVQFETRDGTATAPGDYRAVTRTLTFSAGSTSSSVMLMAAEDNLSEPAETFSAVLRNPSSGLSLGTQATATITIPQSDTPIVQFNPRTYTASEGDTENLRIVLSNPSSSAVSVLVSTSDVTTQAGSDYTAIAMRVTFAPGTTTQTLALTTLEDSISEQPETLTATLSSPVGASLATDPTATITIRDDDVVMVSFDPTSYSVTEGGSTMATVVLSSRSTRTITVDATSSGGTATDSDDYTTVSRTLTFQSGVTSVSFPVMASTDQIDEVQEDFSVTLSNPTNDAVLGSDNSATIFINDDNIVMASFDRTSYTVTEGGSTTATVVLSGPSTRTITVDVASSGGTATDSDDYTTVSRTLTFQPGVTSASFPVMASTDQIDEVQEDFSITLSNPTNDAVLGSDNTATISINDGTSFMVNFVPATYSVMEGSSVQITAMLNNPADRDVTVDFTTVPGTAAETSDYTPVTQTLTFSMGQTTASVSVTTVEDVVQEGTEQFTATLTNPTSGLQVGPSGTATVNIADNDVVNVQFDPFSYSVSESDGSEELVVILTTPSTDQVTVDFETVEGTAEASSDYTAVFQALTFAAGTVRQTVSVPIINDNTNENGERFTAQLSNVQGASLGPTSTATIDIEDDDPLVINFNPSGYSGSEGESVTLMAMLNRPADREITVTVTTQDGTAQAPDDYSSTSVVLTFPANQQTVSTSIPITDDGINERVETFTATLSSPSGGATLGTASTAICSIQTTPLEVNFDPDSYTVNEGESTQLTLELSSPADRQVSVDVTLNPDSAIAGSDYTAQTTAVTFPVGQTSRTVTVATLQDMISEGTEEFTATLSNPVGGNFIVGSTGSATISIVDDDVVNVQFDPFSYSVSESDGSEELVVILTTPSTDQVTVDFETVEGTAEASSDYTAVFQALTFAAGTVRQTVSVPIINDNTNENGERFTAQLSNVQGASLGPTSTATIDIEDDDPLVINFNPSGYSGSEGESVTLMAMLNRPADREITVTVTTQDGTAQAPDDYSSTSVVLTFPANQQTVSTSIPITDDGINERVETFTATLSSPSGGATLGTASTAICSIQTTPLEVNFDPDSYTVNEGESTQLTLELSSPADRQVSIDVTLNPDSAIAGSDYTAQTTAVTFPVGQTSRTVTVATLQDMISESTEEFTATLSNPVGGNFIVGSTGSATISILDDDALSVQFNPTSYSISEGGTGSITVVLNTPSTSPVTVEVFTMMGSATGSDYMEFAMTITFSPGVTQRIVTVATLTDDINEGNEIFSILLRNVSGAMLGPNSRAEVTISDDDAVVVQFDPTSYSVDEGQSAVITVVSDRVSTRDVTVTVQAVDGTAVFSGDFALNSVSAVIPSGRMSVNVTFPTVDDMVAEVVEEFNLVLASPQNARLGDDRMATVQIRDDDSITINFEESEYEVMEDVDTVELCISLSRPADRYIEVSGILMPARAQEGTDYRGIGIIFNVTAGNIAACEEVDIIDDNILENTETFVAILEDPTTPLDIRIGRIRTINVTIIDDDIIQVSWTRPSTTVPEDVGTVMVCFTTDKQSQSGYSVIVTSQGSTDNPASFGTDYSTTSQTLAVRISAAGNYCIDTTIIDDRIALEGNETFVFSFGNLPSGISVGRVSESSVQILDNDVMAIDFQNPDIIVSESSGEAEICVTRNATTDENMIVTIETGFASATINDIEPVSTNIVFTPMQSVACADIPIKNDLDPELTESFTVRFAFQPGQAQIIQSTPGRVARVTILDDDGDVGTSSCVIQDALSVNPFSARPSYRFRGPCELTAVQSCNGTRPDFSVRVDYLSGTFEIGAIGVVKDGSVWTVRENRQFETTSTETPVVSGTTTTFTQADVTISVETNEVVLSVGDGIGITITRSFAGDGSMMINSSSSSSLLETCGICGTQQGELLSLDGSITPLDASMEVKQAFVSGYRVPARDQSLRPVRPECAVIRNDTVIGDPLYTLPFGTDDLNLCFEIHGSPNNSYNLISDTCVNVNAFYSPVGALNIISSIAVRAEGDSKTCRDIRVDLDNCAASASPMGGGSLVSLTGTLEEDGISVKTYSDRVRIAVPNCQNLRLVMWVICEPAKNDDVPSSIRFHVSRGVNLNPTSHGLLGQFWNIPITTTQISASTSYNVTIQPTNGAPTRYVHGEIYERTWDNTKERCIYLGNSQGGSSRENLRLNDPVIQGHYTDYKMDSLFDTEYDYEEWESDCTA